MIALSDWRNMVHLLVAVGHSLDDDDIQTVRSRLDDLYAQRKVVLG